MSIVQPFPRDSIQPVPEEMHTIRSLPRDSSSGFSAQTPVLLSISGGSGFFPAGFGCAYRLKSEILRAHPTSRIEYGGISSGSIVALFLAAGFRIGHDEAPDDPTGVETYRKFGECFDAWWKTPTTYLFAALEQCLTTILPDDIHTQVNGRLHIGITRFGLRGLYFEVISHYTSKADLVGAVLTSCTLFPVSFKPVRWYRGAPAMDGGYMYNRLILPGYTNYVSTYTHLADCLNWSDWFPSPCLHKSDRLVRAAWSITDRNLSEHGLVKYHMAPKSRTPDWKRVVWWLVQRGMLVYLVLYRLFKIRWWSLLSGVHRWIGRLSR